jgi:hypothetical protein
LIELTVTIAGGPITASQKRDRSATDARNPHQVQVKQAEPDLVSRFLEYAVLRVSSSDVDQDVQPSELTGRTA